jgi:hypothetical protein
MNALLFLTTILHDESRNSRLVGSGRGCDDVRVGRIKRKIADVTTYKGCNGKGNVVNV